MPLILPGNVGSATAATGYDVANSLRFDDGSSDHLTRSLGASETSTTKGTFSFWVKRGQLTTAQMIYTNEVADDNNRGQILFEDDDTFMIRDTVSGSNTTLYATSQLFRDTSAWLHLVVALDSTQAGGNRIRVYKNGTRIPDAQFGTSTEPNQNSNFNVLTGGQTNKNHIGKVHGGSNYFDGYLAEFVYCDGQVLDATSFGEFDEDSGIWKPKDVSGLTFGNNGFYLDFEDSSALGNDAAGSNNFTVNNLTAIDQTTDTGTNNFCTVNPLDNYHQQATLSEGNTKITFKGATSVYAYSTGTFGVASGKWYWETKATSAGNHDAYGISGRYVIAYNKGLGVNTDEYGYYNYNGNYTNAATDGSYREVSFPGGNVTWTTNDIIGVALDLDSGTNTVKFYKNNALIGTIDIIAPSSGFYYPAWNQFDNQAEVAQPNFGNPSYSLSSAQSDANGYGSFEYSPPSGYFSLCTKNLAEYG